ncbi:MAG: glutamate synthase subunit alpha, partial [Myxococcota bacterium]
MNPRVPRKQGLYDPAFEHDACGVGFVANIAGEASHDVVQRGIQVLVNLGHRGACGCDPESGDGAGLLVQIPDALLRRECAARGIELPERERYAVGMVFLAQNPAAAAQQEAHFERIVKREGQALLGWRDVPHEPTAIGRLARAGLPRIRQVFIAAKGREAEDPDAFERKLYVIRR